MMKSKKRIKPSVIQRVGRPNKYNEPTKQVGFACPESKVTEFKAHAKSKLEEWSL